MGFDYSSNNHDIKNVHSMPGRHKNKTFFKNTKRCLIFADGFYEWKWIDKQGRTKVFNRTSEFTIIFFCWISQWIDKQTGEIINAVLL